MNIFVDDSGCPALFNKKGPVNLNNTSKFFIIAQVRITDKSLKIANEKLEWLRKIILTNNELLHIPSVRRKNTKR